MAIFANIDPVITVNAVDLSDHVVSADWTETIDTAESVASGAEFVTVKPTFKRGTLSVEFQQDFASSEVYATLAAIMDADPVVAVAITYKANSGATAATNPEMQTNAVLTSMPVIAGAVGQIPTVTASFVFDGTTVTRAVA